MRSLFRVQEWLANDPQRIRINVNRVRSIRFDFDWTRWNANAVVRLYNATDEDTVHRIEQRPPRASRFGFTESYRNDPSSGDQRRRLRLY